jgi:hypothetical protein
VSVAPVTGTDVFVLVSDVKGDPFCATATMPSCQRACHLDQARLQC